MKVAPILIQLVVGQRAVRVDPVDDAVGEQLQVFGREDSRVFGEQRLTGDNLGRVEAATIHLLEGALNDVDLLRAHLSGSLGGRQHRPDWFQYFAEHRRVGSDRLGRPYSTPRLAPGEAQHRRQHPPHAALTQHGRQVQPPAAPIAWWSINDRRSGLVPGLA